jgi:hypothetical protein
MESEALLHAKNPGHLNLREDDVIRERLDKPVIQHLFRLRE